MYVDKRFSKMRDRVNPISTMVGIILRLGIIILLLGCGKMFCDKAVNTAHYSVSEYQRNQYIKSKLRVIQDLKKQGLISKEELKERVRELEFNPNKQYIKDHR
jgi:hypothetical protein